MSDQENLDRIISILKSRYDLAAAAQSKALDALDDAKEAFSDASRALHREIELQETAK